MPAHMLCRRCLGCKLAWTVCSVCSPSQQALVNPRRLAASGSPCRSFLTRVLISNHRKQHELQVTAELSLYCIELCTWESWELLWSFLSHTRPFQMIECEWARIQLFPCFLPKKKKASDTSPVKSGEESTASQRSAYVTRGWRQRALLCDNSWNYISKPVKTIPAFTKAFFSPLQPLNTSPFSLMWWLALSAAAVQRCRPLVWWSWTRCLMELTDGVILD